MICSPFHEVPLPGMRAIVKYHKGRGDLIFNNPSPSREHSQSNGQVRVVEGASPSGVCVFTARFFPVSLRQAKGLT